MWRLIWRLLTIGIPLDFTANVSYAVLAKQCRQLSAWQQIRSQQSGRPIAVRLNDHELTACVIRFVTWLLARPIYYATITDSTTAVRLSGKFYFQKSVRIEFWLIIFAFCAYELIWLNRAIGAYLDGIPIDSWIGYALAILPGPIFLLLLLTYLKMSLRHTFEDMNRIADELKTLAAQD